MCATRVEFGDPAMLRHNQNTNGSRTEPQTALSISTSCAEAALTPLAVDMIHTRNTTRILFKRFSCLLFLVISIIK